MVKGGGARNADDKIIQNNAASSVTIDGFSAQNFGKLYRSCGNCKGNGAKRNVTIKNVKASGGKVLAGINSSKWNSFVKRSRRALLTYIRRLRRCRDHLQHLRHQRQEALC